MGHEGCVGAWLIGAQWPQQKHMVTWGQGPFLFLLGHPVKWWCVACLIPAC